MKEENKVYKRFCRRCERYFYISEFKKKICEKCDTRYLKDAKLCNCKNCLARYKREKRK